MVTEQQGGRDAGVGAARARVYLNDQLSVDLERGRVLPVVLRVPGSTSVHGRVSGVGMARGVLRLELLLKEFASAGPRVAVLTTPLGVMEASGDALRLHGSTLSLRVDEVVAHEVRSWAAPVSLRAEVRTEGGERSPARVVRVHSGSVWIEGVRDAERGDLLHLHVGCGARDLLIPLEVKGRRDAQVRAEVLDGARLVGQHLSELRGMFEEVLREQLWTPRWAGTGT